MLTKYTHDSAVSGNTSKSRTNRLHRVHHAKDRSTLLAPYSSTFLIPGVHLTGGIADGLGPQKPLKKNGIGLHAVQR